MCMSSNSIHMCGIHLILEFILYFLTFLQWLMQSAAERETYISKMVFVPDCYQVLTVNIFRFGICSSQQKDGFSSLI